MVKTPEQMKAEVLAEVARRLGWKLNVAEEILIQKTFLYQSLYFNVALRNLGSVIAEALHDDKVAFLVWFGTYSPCCKVPTYYDVGYDQTRCTKCDSIC